MDSLTTGQNFVSMKNVVKWLSIPGEFNYWTQLFSGRQCGLNPIGSSLLPHFPGLLVVGEAPASNLVV